MLLKNGYNTDGTPGLGFMTKHKNLSENLKNTLFTPEENTALSNAQSVAQTKAGRKTTLNTAAAKYGLGGIVGGGLGHALGIPWYVGAPIGAGLAGGTKHLGMKLLSPDSLGEFNSLFKPKDQSPTQMGGLLKKSPLLTLGAMQGANQ